MLIVGLHAAGNIDVPAQLLHILMTGERQQLGNQLIALSLCDELGRGDCVNQNLQLGQIIRLPIIVVLVLHGLVIFDMEIAVMQHGQVITDGIATDLDIVFFFQRQFLL